MPDNVPVEVDAARKHTRGAEGAGDFHMNNKAGGQCDLGQADTPHSYNAVVVNGEVGVGVGCVTEIEIEVGVEVWDKATMSTYGDVRAVRDKAATGSTPVEADKALMTVKLPAQVRR